jgi:hypothetical protein
MARDRRPARTARTPRLALTRWSPPDRREHQPAALRHDGELRRLSRQPIFGGTTEIQKEIIRCRASARGSGRGQSVTPGGPPAPAHEQVAADRRSPRALHLCDASSRIRPALSLSPTSRRRMRTRTPAICPRTGWARSSRTRRPGAPLMTQRPRKSVWIPASAHHGAEVSRTDAMSDSGMSARKSPARTCNLGGARTSPLRLGPIPRPRRSQPVVGDKRMPNRSAGVSSNVLAPSHPGRSLR